MGAGIYREKPQRGYLLKGDLSEADLARFVVTELQRQGFTTYEEVCVGYGGQRADIVGVRGPVVAVVECKTSLSLKLLDQLAVWRGRAHLIVGAHGYTRGGASARRYCQLEGFGLWAVHGERIDEDVCPRLWRRADVRIKAKLCEEQRSGEFAKAGTQGGYWTPFGKTVRDLKIYAGQHPGAELKTALHDIQHHYSSMRSAVSSIPALIRNGVIAGLKVDGDPLKLYLDGPS